MRAESDGSSDKHTGNERERLTDSTRLPLMGSGLTWVMAEALKRGKKEREKQRRTETSQRGGCVLFNKLSHTYTYKFSGCKTAFLLFYFIYNLIPFLPSASDS